MKNFAAYTVGLDLVRALTPVIEQLRRRSADLADHVDRARTSVVLNICEGARRTGKDQRRFYTIANGSASELRGALDIAAALDWHLDDREARALLDRELGLLWGLTRDRGRAA
jgi:four helix bundle protein